LCGTARMSRYQKGKTNQEGKTNLDLLQQKIVSGNGISWAKGKSAPRPTQPHQNPTTPATQPIASKHWRHRMRSLMKKEGTYVPWRCLLRQLSISPGFVSSRRRCHRVSCGSPWAVSPAPVSPSAKKQVPSPCHPACCQGPTHAEGPGMTQQWLNDHRWRRPPSALSPRPTEIKAIVDDRLSPAVQLTWVGLLPVFIVKQNVVGISTAVFYHRLGIHTTRYGAIMWKRDAIHKTGSSS